MRECKHGYPHNGNSCIHCKRNRIAELEAEEADSVELIRLQTEALSEVMAERDTFESAATKALAERDALNSDRAMLVTMAESVWFILREIDLMMEDGEDAEMIMDQVVYEIEGMMTELNKYLTAQEWRHAQGNR